MVVAGKTHDVEETLSQLRGCGPITMRLDRLQPPVPSRTLRFDRGEWSTMRRSYCINISLPARFPPVSGRHVYFCTFHPSFAHLSSGVDRVV
jgi:hypothetical protein